MSRWILKSIETISLKKKTMMFENHKGWEIGTQPRWDVGGSSTVSFLAATIAETFLRDRPKVHFMAYPYSMGLNFVNKTLSTLIGLTVGEAPQRLDTN